MLTIEDIREGKVKGNANLALVKKHQDWVRMHADTRLSPAATTPYAAFLGMVNRIISPEKIETFRALLRDPLPTTELVNEIFDRLHRVFEGKNPSFNYQFEKTEYADDWEWYRQEVLHEPEVWRNMAWDYYRTEPNSIVVVDMPREGEDDKEDKYPQPYFYFVSADYIVDYKTDNKGVIEWVMYKDPDGNKLYVIDEQYYRVFECNSENATGIGDIEVEAEHGLGFCPATFLVTTPVSLSTPDVKKSPITDVLSELDWYLFYDISKKHLDTYGSYPIYSGYERVCDYKEEVHQGDKVVMHHCKGGIMVDDYDEVILTTGGEPKRCPVCGGHRIAGAGGFWEVPVPNTNEGIPDMRNPVQILAVDHHSLDYNTKELERKKGEIITACVGVDGDMLNEFSVSETQVDANYEKMSTKLLCVKRDFEQAEIFVDRVCCMLRYGKMFTALDINYGTEFYSGNTTYMRKRYNTAKEGGASETDLMALRRQVAETEYRNNKLQLQRQIILTDLEPYPGKSSDEVFKLFEKGLVPAEIMSVKADFEGLIRRFERENGNVINFGSAMDYDKKIEKITQILKYYVKD